MRVHELAKELGVTSKTILMQLKAEGEFVKSASSTLTGPVANRVRESFAANRFDPNGSSGRVHQSRRVPATAQANVSANEAEKRVGATPWKGVARLENEPRRTSSFTSDDAFEIFKRHQIALKSKNPSQSVDELFRACEARFGISRSAVVRVVTSEKLRRRSEGHTRSTSAKGTTVQKPATRETSRVKPKKKRRSTDSREEKRSPSVRLVDVNARARPRIPGLPVISATMNRHAVADLVNANSSSAPGAGEIASSLARFVSKQPGSYGYLAWRYAASRAAHSDEGSLMARDDLVSLAVVIDHERQLLDTLAHGSILGRPGIAERALEQQFRELGASHRRRLESDELRRSRASFDFLRRAVVLTIASPNNDARLWHMLGEIQEHTVEHQEMRPQLARANRRLTELSAAIDRLLSTDEANLTQFYDRSHTDLVALQTREYDYLRRFRDSAAVALMRPASADLAFQVLPQGERLRAFLGEVRASKRFRGYRVDEQRLSVLEELQSHFGADRCVWHVGSDTSSGVGNRYLVLAIKSGNRSRDEDAVAISPLAGRHATYVVRRECADADWRVLFARPKFEARMRGARKLLFTDTRSQVDQYSAMRDKIIHLLECRPREFASARYY